MQFLKNKLFIQILFLSIFIPLCLYINSFANGAFKEIDDNMTFGEDLNKDKKSLELAEKALAADPHSYQLMWRVARAFYFVGDNVAKKEKLFYFEKGIAVGEKAIAKQPQSVEGHFWLGVNYGGYADQKGGIKALTTVKKIRAQMEEVLKINDTYFHAGAYHALGEMDRQIPRLFGGNLKRSLQRLEKGVQLAPDNFAMRYALAEAYIDDDRKDEAKKQLQEILKQTINPSRAKSEKSTQEEAQKLLAKL